MNNHAAGQITASSVLALVTSMLESTIPVDIIWCSIILAIHICHELICPYVNAYTVLFTLNTHDVKVQPTKALLTPVSFFRSVIWEMLLETLCVTMITRPSPLLGLSAFTLFLMMLSHTGGKLHLPPSVLRFRFSSVMCKASFTPLSNHLDSVVSISVFSDFMECWG